MGYIRGITGGMLAGEKYTFLLDCANSGLLLQMGNRPFGQKYFNKQLKIPQCLENVLSTPVLDRKLPSTCSNKGVNESSLSPRWDPQVLRVCWWTERWRSDLWKGLSTPNTKSGSSLAGGLWR